MLHHWISVKLDTLLDITYTNIIYATKFYWIRYYYFFYFFKLRLGLPESVGEKIVECTITFVFFSSFKTYLNISLWRKLTLRPFYWNISTINKNTVVIFSESISLFLVQFPIGSSFDMDVCLDCFWKCIFFLTGSAVPSVLLIFTCYVGCREYAVAGLMTACLFFKGVWYTGVKTNCVDISKNYAGTVMALVNGFGCISGFMAPEIVGWFTKNVNEQCIPLKSDYFFRFINKVSS